jgi:hypothetical protein
VDVKKIARTASSQNVSHMLTIARVSSSILVVVAAGLILDLIHRYLRESLLSDVGGSDDAN